MGACVWSVSSGLVGPLLVSHSISPLESGLAWICVDLPDLPTAWAAPGETLRQERRAGETRRCCASCSPRWAQSLRYGDVHRSVCCTDASPLCDWKWPVGWHWDHVRLWCTITTSFCLITGWAISSGLTATDLKLFPVGGGGERLQNRYFSSSIIFLYFLAQHSSVKEAFYLASTDWKEFTYNTLL